MPTNCLSVFDHFVGLALKGLNEALYVRIKYQSKITKIFFLKKRLFQHGYFHRTNNEARYLIKRASPISRKLWWCSNSYIFQYCNIRWGCTGWYHTIKNMIQTKGPNLMYFHTKVLHQAFMLHCFDASNFICNFLNCSIIVRIESNLNRAKDLVQISGFEIRIIAYTKNKNTALPLRPLSVYHGLSCLLARVHAMPNSTFDYFQSLL